MDYCSNCPKAAMRLCTNRWEIQYSWLLLLTGTALCPLGYEKSCRKNKPPVMNCHRKLKLSKSVFFSVLKKKIRVLFSFSFKAFNKEFINIIFYYLAFSSLFLCFFSIQFFLFSTFCFFLFQWHSKNGKWKQKKKANQTFLRFYFL